MTTSPFTSSASRHAVQFATPSAASPDAFSRFAAAVHTTALLAIAVTVSACSDDNDTTPNTQPDAATATPDEMITEPDAAPDLTRCTSTITTTGSFVELCSPQQGSVKHVRIDNVMAAATHASAQIVFGFDAPPASAQAALEPDQFRVLFYGGGTPAPAAQVQASFGGVTETFDGSTAWVNAGATVCFDLHDGSNTAAPAFVLWVDGINGADCDASSTLTLVSAYASRALWKGATGSIAKTAKMYFRQSAGTPPTVHLSSTAILDAAAIIAATSCTTMWATNTDWQPMCAPSGGKAKHVRIENASATANNSYIYAVIGQDANPSGNPAPSAGKLLVTFGRSSSGASWTWFRFDDGSTTQFNYATDAAAALYTAAPSTICFDIGSSSTGTARLVFWATGANGADCATRTSLTAANALYDSTTDATTGAIWDVPFVSGKSSFIKTNNSTGSIGAVTVLSEAAVL